MDGFIQYITNPSTIVSFIIFVFGLGATWNNLNGRIKQLEKRTEEIDIGKIETKLAEIATDLQRVKLELQKLSK